MGGRERTDCSRCRARVLYVRIRTSGSAYDALALRGWLPGRCDNRPATRGVCPGGDRQASADLARLPTTRRVCGNGNRRGGEAGSPCPWRRPASRRATTSGINRSATPIRRKAGLLMSTSKQEPENSFQMKCPRCETVMVLESFPNWASSECLLFESWHCSACGYIHEAGNTEGASVSGTHPRNEEDVSDPSRDGGHHDPG
jgi:hypothetical protein